MANYRILQFLIYSLFISAWSAHGVSENVFKMPTVGIVVLVRNKIHTLPYFLTCLYNLKYPKDRIYLWIHSDFNEDKSDAVLEKWAELHGREYNGVHLTTNASSGPLHPDELRATHWSPKRFEHVIQLREDALDFARKLWADFVFMLDADVFLPNQDTLRLLVEKDLPVVAPMLLSDGLYSNFWCGMTENYYYLRTDEYKPIQSRENVGCFAVPMVHSAVLVSLRRAAAASLSYRAAPHHRAPTDDIIAFAVNAKYHGIPLHICNDHLYGFVPVPLEDTDEPQDDLEQVMNVKLEAISRQTPLPLSEELASFVTYPEPWKFGCGEIFMINLERRPERRRMMEASFKELGMDATYFKAIDGRDLDMDDLGKLSINLMPEYEDPYHKRPMKAGEVGCFLSHYYIWKSMVEKQTGITLVLEDDIHFVPYFRHHFLNLLNELEGQDWDLVYIYTDKIRIQTNDDAFDLYYSAKKYMLPHLMDGCIAYLLQNLTPQNVCHIYDFARMYDEIILLNKCIQRVLTQCTRTLSLDQAKLRKGRYIGRKILQDGSEEYVTEHTTRPLYSYWTLGYLLTPRGAQKLIDAKPLDHLLPVDEFLPIMFDQHPNSTWKAYFKVRNLVALSAAPLLAHPTHYTGQQGYVSDTEDSRVVQLPPGLPPSPRPRHDL